MKKYLLLVFIFVWMVGCAQKSNKIDIAIPKNANPLIKEALNSYKLLKQDKSYEKIVPSESYKASILAQKVLDNIDNLKLANHYAYLLKNQVEITKLAKRRLNLISELNDIITKRNDAIAEMKKELKESDDSQDSDTENITSMDEEKLKNIFQFHDNSFTINGKYFDNDEVVPNRNLKKLIIYLANYLKNNPTKTLVLDSYTDGVGSSAYSIDLSLRRANRIKEMLVDRDVEEDRVIVEPKGAVDFIASNNDENGRIQNNRIVIHIK